MLIYPEKVLLWYLKKQFLSVKNSDLVNDLTVFRKTGWPDPNYLFLSQSSRIENYSIISPRKLIQENQIIEIRISANKKIVVPKELAWDFIKIFSDNSKVKLSGEERRLYQEIKEIPFKKNDIKAHPDLSSTIQSLLNSGKIIEIYDSANNNFEYIDAEAILGKDLSKESYEKRFKKVAIEFFKVYGPATIPELTIFFKKNVDFVKTVLKDSGQELCSFRVKDITSSFICLRDDLKNIITWNGQARFRPNLVFCGDHAFQYKKKLLNKVIPGFEHAEFLALDKGKVVGLFDKEAVWQPLPNFDNKNKKLFNIFLALLKLRKSEQEIKV